MDAEYSLTCSTWNNFVGKNSCKNLSSVVYNKSAAVLVTRGFTGPDRYRTTWGIKLNMGIMFRPMDTSDDPGSAPT